jgi:hypothetical protein
MRSRTVIAGLFAAFALSSSASESEASTLRCREGVRTKVFARFTFPTRGDRVPTLSDQLQAWGDGIGWKTGGVETEDPNATPPSHNWEAILQTPTYGTAITVETSATKKFGRVTVANNCWAPQEDWRP